MQHLNHRFTPNTEVSRPLWFDSQLQQRFQFPRSPNGVLSLDEETGIPVYRVFPDAALPVKRVEIYYGYDRDPRNRFWADAEAREIQNFWRANAQSSIWMNPCLSSPMSTTSLPRISESGRPRRIRFKRRNCSLPGPTQEIEG